MGAPRRAQEHPRGQLPAEVGASSIDALPRPLGQERLGHLVALEPAPVAPHGAVRSSTAPSRRAVSRPPNRFCKPLSDFPHPALAPPPSAPNTPPRAEPASP